MPWDPNRVENQLFLDVDDTFDHTRRLTRNQQFRSKFKTNEAEYKAKFKQRFRDLLPDCCDWGTCYYGTKWGPPSDLLRKASSEFPHIIVKNSWEMCECCSHPFEFGVNFTECDCELAQGYEIFHNGNLVEGKK